MVNASFSKDELPEVKRIMNDKRFPEYYRHNFFMYYISIIRYSSKLYKAEIPKIKHFLANANMNALYFVSFSQSFMYVLDFKSTYLYINMIYGKYDYRNTFKEATYMMGITLIPVSFFDGATLKMYMLNIQKVPLILLKIYRQQQIHFLLRQ